MTKPQRFLLRMAIFFIAVLAIAVALYVPLLHAFMANPAINGLILGVFLLGVLYNFRQVSRLSPEVAWIENFRSKGQHNTATSSDASPRLLAPMATMLRAKKEIVSLSALSTRSILDGIASRLDESRELSRYTIGVLIFLGLLGTFWGLLGTVGAVGGVIRDLSLTGDVQDMFGDLKTGLEAPLSGMGTAFSSSLFGLAGSLALGFLDLQAGQAQNRFYNDLEEWLSSLTQLSSGTLGGEGEHSVPAYVQALLEQTAENLQGLQHTMLKSEESRIGANTNLKALSDSLMTLTDQLRAQQELLSRMQRHQEEQLRASAHTAEGGTGMDEATRAHIRNMDLHIARLVDDIPQGRDEVIQSLRSEIKLLARTIAAMRDGRQG